MPKETVELEMRDHPRWKRIRLSLGKLAARGAANWVIQEQSPLLSLKSANALARGVGPRDKADGVRRLLTEAVGDFGEEPQGILLRIVLGLDRKWFDSAGTEYDLLRMRASDRRELAGREFRYGENIVGANAIRLIHEPEALDRLASEIVKREGAVAVSRAAAQLFESGQRVKFSGTYEICDETGEPLGRGAMLLKGDRFPSLDMEDGSIGHRWRLATV